MKLRRVKKKLHHKKLYQFRDKYFTTFDNWTKYVSKHSKLFKK